MNHTLKSLFVVLGAAAAAGAGHAQQVELPRVEVVENLSSMGGIGALGDLASLKSLASLQSLSSLRSLGSLQGLSGLQEMPGLRAMSGLRRLEGLRTFASIAPDAGSSWSYSFGDGGGPAHRVPEASWNKQDPADSLWREARQAVADGDYRAASRLFQRLVDRYPRSEYAGDALYWQAWSIYKNGQESRITRESLENALAALDHQAKDYPDARTRDDARDLRTRIKSAQARLGDPRANQFIQEQADSLTKGRCPGEDDDPRVAALQALMQMDAESAMPILRQVLKKRDACAEPLRKQAVFIVSQKSGEESAQLLLETARTDPSEEVRADAIQWLGQSRSDLAIPALDSILNSASEHDVREKAIFALSQQRDPSAAQAIKRFVENDRMPEDLRANGVFWLGQNRGTTAAYLRELYGRTRNEQLREAIIQAMSQSRDPDASKWLLDIATDRDQPVEARKNALFWASQQRQIDFARLSRFYDDMKDQQEMQEQVIFLLSQRREAEATDKLMDIARREQNRELRKNAIFWLGQKKDPRVVQFLMELINK